MKRLLVLLGAVVGATALAGAALAADPTTPPPNVWQGTTTPTNKVSLYVDNVWGSGPTAPVGGACAQSNQFKRGQTAVFRVWGFEAKSGKPLTPENVVYAYVKIPGLPNQALTFGKHGKFDNSPWFWTLGWVVPANYPLGTVAFKVVYKTTSGVFGTFDQSALSTNSQLTIMPS